MPAAHPNISTLPTMKELRGVSPSPSGWALLVLVTEDHGQGTFVLSLTDTCIHLMDDTFLLPPHTHTVSLPPLTPKL